MRYAEHVRKIRESMDTGNGQLIIEVYNQENELVKTKERPIGGRMDQTIRVREKGFGRLVR